MLKHRVIPALLLRNNGLVKTKKFKDPRYIGDPINAIRIFNEKEVDELMVLDISASKEGRDPNYELIEQLAGECFMPLAYGGGIRNTEQAKRVFSSGVEKVCLQSASLVNSSIITELADRFGSQSIMVSVDVRRDWLGRPRIYSSLLGKPVKSNWLEHLTTLVEAGAGEVLFNVVDKEGTLSGPDLDLIEQASQMIEVPLIGSGGISSLTDIKDMTDAGASAVAAGSFFVFHGPHNAVLITYPKYQELEQLFKEC